MNSTANFTDFTNSNDQLKLIINLSDLVSYYFISGVSSVGFLLNINMLFLLWNKLLKHRFYEYLRIKAVIDTCISLIGLLDF